MAYDDSYLDRAPAQEPDKPPVPRLTTSASGVQPLRAPEQSAAGGADPIIRGYNAGPGPGGGQANLQPDLSASQAAITARSAANPVIANPSTNGGQPGVIAQAWNAVAGAFGPIKAGWPNVGPEGYGNSAGGAYPGAAPPGSMVPRSSAPQRPGVTSSAVPQSVAVPEVRAVDVGGPVISPTASSVRPADSGLKSEIAAANDRQAAIDQNAQLAQNVAQANAWTAQRDAQSAARIANFRATDGADMVLAGGNRRQKEAIVGAAANANKSLTDANNAVIAAQKPAAVANPVDQLVKTQGLTHAEADAAMKGAQTQSILDTAKISQDHQKLIHSLSEQLAKSTSGDEQDRLKSAIGSLLGKDNVARYAVHVVPGEEVIGPDGITKTKTASRVFLSDTQRGTGQFLGEPLPSQKAKAPPNPDTIYTDPKTGKKGKYDPKTNTWVPA